MDKKKWTRVLIAVVASLWGYNIYRTVENYQVKTESQNEQIKSNTSFAPVMFNKDTFLLDLPLDDPFLRNGNQWRQSNTNASHPPTNQNPKNSHAVKTAPPVIKETKWPPIQYFGFILNREEDHQLCILNIADKNYRLSIGESKDQVTVVRAYSDSIILSFQNKMKTVSR